MSGKSSYFVVVQWVHDLRILHPLLHMKYYLPEGHKAEVGGMERTVEMVGGMVGTSKILLSFRVNTPTA